MREQFQFINTVFQAISILLIKPIIQSQNLCRMLVQIAKLPKPNIDCEQGTVLWSIFDSVQKICDVLRHTPVVKLETQNKFGDIQLHQDVHCDEVVQHHLRENPRVRGFASQERPELHQMNQDKNQEKTYIVTYDPLDGSSIIDTNFAVGSIFSIWPYSEKKLIGQKLSYQKNAVLALYGPRTTVIFYNPTLDKVQQLTLIDNQWVVSHQNLVIKPTTKMYSPGNLRATSENKPYAKVVQTWIEKEYTLRYTGGLVPDVQQIFIKGHGIFVNFESQKHKTKLRVLYEVAAVGYLVQKAHGATLTYGNMSLMDYVIKTYDDKLPFAAGSRQQVEALSKDLF